MWSVLEETPLTLLDVALVCLGASGLGGMWVLQWVWVSPMAELFVTLDAQLPLMTMLAIRGVLAGVGTLGSVLLVGVAVRTRPHDRLQSQVALAAAALLPAIIIVAQVLAITTPLFELSPTLSP